MAQFNGSCSVAMLIWGGLILSLPPVQAQEVLLEESPALYDFEPPTYGPNARNYWHVWLATGIITGGSEGNGAAIVPGQSNCIDVGIRYKLKLANFYALGFSADYQRSIFQLVQDESKKIPNSMLHDKEKLRFNKLNIECYQRFNVGKRGNIIGKFWDIGVYAGWAFRVSHLTKDKYDEPNTNRGKQVRTVTRQLDYIEPLVYGFRSRIGINFFSVFLDYRASSLFNDHFDAELPRYCVGLQLGLHNLGA